MNEQEEKSVTAANIPHSEFKTMIREYRRFSRRPPAYLKGKHVKSVWFDVNKIKKMCEDIITEGGDGIRVYFGRYPNDVTTFVNSAHLETNSNTVILVSTKKTGNTHKDYFTKVNPVDKSKATDPENRGEQCRPHCDGTTDDGEDEEDPII